MDHTRHIDIYDMKNADIALIGAGGIGATTAIALAKMGVLMLDIHDMDKVGTENIATQLHRLSDIGTYKSRAIVDTIQEYANGVVLSSFISAVDKDTRLDTKYVICAVDNIVTRKAVFQNLLNSINRVHYFIDARMSAEEFHLYTVDMFNPKSRERYQAMIDQESDENVPDLPCTMKATIYTAFMAAGHICNAVKKLEMGEKHPFSLIHNIKTFTFLAG